MLTHRGSGWLATAGEVRGLRCLQHSPAKAFHEPFDLSSAKAPLHSQTYCRKCKQTWSPMFREVVSGGSPQKSLDGRATQHCIFLKYKNLLATDLLMKVRAVSHSRPFSVRFQLGLLKSLLTCCQNQNDVRSCEYSCDEWRLSTPRLTKWMFLDSSSLKRDITRS